LESGCEHGASAILFQPLDSEILPRTPDHTTLMVHTRASGPHQEHVSAAYLRELADVGEVLAAVSGFIQEYRHFAGRRHPVNDVVDDAAGEQIALGAIPACNPDRPVDETES